MKRFKRFMGRLSLTQQLSLIVAFMLSFFLIFSFVTLSSQIDGFTTQQIYTLIHRAQEDVIYNYKRGMNRDDLFGANDPNIIHVIKTREGEYLSNGMNRIQQDFLNQITIQMDAETPVGTIDYRYKDGSLYAIASIDKDASIATLIPYTYSDDFKTMLVNNVINIILIVIAVFFFLLLLWVIYIIHPLNQMRDYIIKIRNNEKNPTLKIDRYDEIGDLARMLVEMNEEIKRQQKSKEEMIQNISHDLKTPIATIKSYGESIKDGVYPYETLEKSVDVIIEHAQRLEDKVQSLLTLNRMDYLTNEQDKAGDCNIREIVETVIVSSKQIRPEIAMDVEIEADATVYGRIEPWRVVLENLLENALRYAKTRILIRGKPDMLSIYNDGPPIDLSQIDRLFNAYETGEGGEFGLGLAIVNRVVTNYGYQIQATNIDDGVLFEIKKGDKNYGRKKR